MFSYHFEQENRVPSPALIYYRDEIEKNTAETIRIAGDAQRLWPHVKTHKMREMIQMQLAMGIHRFKCATVSEIRMVASAGADHILWAYPVVGPNVFQFLQLVREYPACTLYALEDDWTALEVLSREASLQEMTVNVLLDVNIGMNRTGLSPAAIVPFYRKASQLKGIRLRGLHCYDGHIHDDALDVRMAHASDGAETAALLRNELIAEGFDAEILIMGGTPTFPCHTVMEDVFLSPGTLFVSDAGYHSHFPDIDVTPAAAVLTRVISHPAEGLFTLDTGTKAVSADAVPRGVLVGMEEKCEPILSSEEHWVFAMKPEYINQRPAIGSVLFVIPTHICPTTALYDAAYVVSNGRLVDIWQVSARERIGKAALEDVL